MNSDTNSPEQPTFADATPDARPLDAQSAVETYRGADEPLTKGLVAAGQVSRRRKMDWAAWNPALTLENAGSVARDHLASERTFLAYVRTSLTIASTGVALVQLFTISAATTNHALEPWSRPIGATIIALGLSTLCFGVVRYFSIQNALLGGNYPVARVSTILLAITLGIIIVVVFGVLIGVRSRGA